MYLIFKHGSQGRKRLKSERAETIYGNFRHPAWQYVLSQRKMEDVALVYQLYVLSSERPGRYITTK